MSEKIIAAAAILLAGAATWFALKPDAEEPAPVAAGQQVVMGIPAAPSDPAAPGDNKDQAHALYTEGLRHFQSADYAKARAEWEEALKLDPENQDAAAGLERIKKITAE